jgi:hypothetical protein
VQVSVYVVRAHAGDHAELLLHGRVGGRGLHAASFAPAPGTQAQRTGIKAGLNFLSVGLTILGWGEGLAHDHT